MFCIDAIFLFGPIGSIVFLLGPSRPTAGL
jgi:hypothetical protein